MSEFGSLRNTLRRSQDVAHVECLYLIFPDIKTHRLIYLVDGAYEDVWDPGTLEVLYDTDFKKKGDIKSGFASLISDTEEGGKLLTTASPILDYKNQVIAYAGLDYSIEGFLQDQRNYMLLAGGIIALLAVIATVIAVKIIDRNIVRPINALSDASVRYNAASRDEAEDSHSFADLNIHTGDEIETLADSMIKMEQNISDYIKDLLTLRNNKDTQAWLRMDAAVGYAVFDPGMDKDASDVFERADKAMYDNKVKIKAVRL